MQQQLRLDTLARQFVSSFAICPSFESAGAALTSAAKGLTLTSGSTAAEINHRTGQPNHLQPQQQKLCTRLALRRQINHMDLKKHTKQGDCQSQLVHGNYHTIRDNLCSQGE